MIRIVDSTLCCGCSACVNACPVHCIVMSRDIEGFDYPNANQDLCINCGKCEDVCPMLHGTHNTHTLCAHASRIDDNLSTSSSGGIFPALADKILSDGGSVFGAVLEDDMTVGHCEAVNHDQIEPMKSSKYVQSDLYSTFEEIDALLYQDKKVLFTGTPCQVAALDRYVTAPRQGLLAVDFACHGVPAPGLWKRYVKALEERAAKKIVDIKFRDKSRSWRHYGMRITYSDGSAEYVSREKDPYLSLFLQNMTLRPSCYECKFKCGASGSDITLSDLWSVPGLAPQMNDDRGVSGVFVNTEKGLNSLESISLSEFYQVDVDAARTDNGGFSSQIQRPGNREEFFRGAHLTTDLIRYMKGYVVSVSIYKGLYRRLRKLFSRIKRRVVR